MKVYPPEEDSYLLSEVLGRRLKELLKEKPNMTFLDMGTGTAIQAVTAMRSGVKISSITAVDKNPKAVENAKKLGFRSKESNLFKEIKTKFDAIAFNPPYLPADRFDSRPDTSGGKKGNEVIKRFLKQARDFIKPKGRIFLLFSSKTPKFSFHPYKSKKLAEKGLFFEKLYVYELWL